MDAPEDGTPVRGIRGLGSLRREGRWFSVLSYGAFTLLLLGLLLSRGPAYEWDMIGYIACAKEGEITDPVALHSWVFTEVKQAPRST